MEPHVAGSIHVVRIVASSAPLIATGRRVSGGDEVTTITEVAIEIPWAVEAELLLAFTGIIEGHVEGGIADIWWAGEGVDDEAIGPGGNIEVGSDSFFDGAVIVDDLIVLVDGLRMILSGVIKDGE